MAKLPISVVICVMNGEKTLESCLQSITDNNPTEIIIMDGASTDRTLEIGQKYTNKIYVSHQGMGYRFQRGTDLATEDYVAYIDSDVVVPPGTLETMLAELSNSDYAAIHAQILAGQISNHWEWARQEDIRIQYNHPGKTVRGIPTMTALWKKDIVLKYKFDPFFTGAFVDGDICHEVVAAGYKFGCSEAVTYHYHRSSLTALMKQRYWHGQGGGRFIWKHKFFWGWVNMLFPVGPLHLISCIINRKPHLLPYIVVCDGSLWAGTIVELWRLLRNRLLGRQVA
ncbi:MAG: hypothetical protein CL873_01330 [Dehalococcoidales bacterium]|nr:hypothetical protein [Dehalococcoidales bacterium]|tara:strand:+ start:2305 stop:3153 length:849 start_codon:yes stop_codon:yes gene_type:complete